MAVVHCKAGKGRTGVMICALMVYCGYSESAEEAMAVYGARRTRDAKVRRGSPLSPLAAAPHASARPVVRG